MNTSSPYARYATAGGQTVDVSYKPDGIHAVCCGCPARRGPNSEFEIRKWSRDHAKHCHAQPDRVQREVPR